MFQRKTQKIETDFRRDIPEYSDEKIIEILKQREHYQPEAAQLAISEAIKRGIIFSEQDLFAEEYKVEELHFSLFPNIKKEENRINIRKSIGRSLVIFGVMPMVFGMLQVNKGNILEGGAILLMGVLWMYSSAQVIKYFHKLFLSFLLIESVLGMAYIVSKLLLLKRFIFFDFFIPSVLFLLIIYGLLFLLRISD